MAKTVHKISEILENEWVESIVTASNGFIIIVVAGLFYYLVPFRLPGPLRLAGHIIGGVAVLLGLVILALAAHRSWAVRKIPHVGFFCPYCDMENHLTATPTEDFDCDFCHRTIHFQKGVPVPVRTIVCPFCRTEHRVATTVERYVCDRCNRLLKVTSGSGSRAAVGATTSNEQDALLQNYDVLLVAYDRRRENDLAFKLQNLMVINLLEARRLLGTVSTKTPLIVCHSLSQRKAEAVRRQLQELGATASLRSAASAGPAPSKRG
ncbi:MAG TPA: hypothetical protein VFA07_04180 [Chthonomonadaceae bacterium]|nr:hypothetical protein [Chthonomonadaceae bacterium]